VQCAVNVVAYDGCYSVLVGAIDIEIAMLALKAWTEDK